MVSEGKIQSDGSDSRDKIHLDGSDLSGANLDLVDLRGVAPFPFNGSNLAGGVSDDCNEKKFDWQRLTRDVVSRVPDHKKESVQQRLNQANERYENAAPFGFISTRQGINLRL